MKKRKYYKNIWGDFNKEKEMIFISGARQTGKTTLAKGIASQEPVAHYFNYDVPENKTKLLAKPSFFEDINRKKDDRPLIILDEIHKYKEQQAAGNLRLPRNYVNLRFARLPRSKLRGMHSQFRFN